MVARERLLMSSFSRYIGIDYSGAQTPAASLRGLRVYLANGDAPPVEVPPPPSPRKYWTRRGIAEWLLERLAEMTPAASKKQLALELQPALDFANPSLHGLIVEDARFKIPRSAGSAVLDGISHVAHKLSVRVEQIQFYNQIREPLVARIFNRPRNIA